MLKPPDDKGFSIVYLATDEQGNSVAIKEYMPAALATRKPGEYAPYIAPENINTYRIGLKCFFEEGRALASIYHPNIVRVLNFFRANETVYMVMRYERGRTLQEHIHKKTGAIKEDWMRGTFTHLLNGLREVHTNKLLHLDIKPGNIYVRNDGTPVLIDFGAARQTLTVDGLKLPPMYTPGFASPEHHRERDKLGPWSDIYSIGASMYACLAGAGPPTATQRLEKDKMTSARKGWSNKYSAELLDTIDWCLRLDHMERPQSVLALQKALRGETAPGFRGEAPMMDQLKTAFLRLTQKDK